MKYNSSKDSNYHPEIVESKLLSDNHHTIFRMIIRGLNWKVILSRYDVQYSVINLAWYSQLPREGHMLALKGVLGYLKSHVKRKIIYDTTMPDLSE